MDFQPQSEGALNRSSDDELIEYISQAREAGAGDELRKALGILAYRRIGDVRARIQLKVKHDEDIEDLTIQVMTDTFRATFDGEHVGEFVNLLHTVTQRRIADFYSKNRLETDPLADEHEDDEEIFGQTPSVGGHEDPVIVESLVTEDLNGLSPAHKMVVAHYLDGHPAEEVAELVNGEIGPDDAKMTAPNVHQITKRFRDRMRLALEGGT